MALVLCTGIDPGLIETRKLILKQAGHTVVTATDPQEIEVACQQNLFDVAVIGQTASANVKKAIASLIRHQCPSAKILELYPPYLGKALEDADSWLEVPADIPVQLARSVSELARRSA